MEQTKRKSDTSFVGWMEYIATTISELKNIFKL